MTETTLADYTNLKMLLESGSKEKQVQDALICLIDERISINSLNEVCLLTTHPDVVIFTKSPKFNLERMLRQVQPKIVVADGSNSWGFVERCRATCDVLKIEFHATREKGAFLYPK